ncbi:RING-H2 finger protein ATL63-like [Salvia miltiorrhiza]|uniref:RING-H2 finger protein ATL63-like n=1 Tax=Salvia miltiorrhiza TaxID=226208 RepID=UPI0025AB600D|nr:RING-H2 finger protein ATL63-like [Salvia miltiorrhiza]
MASFAAHVAATSLTFLKIFSGQEERLAAAAAAAVFDESSEAEQYCSICLNDVRGGDGYRKLAECGHGFHARCIDVWLRSHSTCPLCRAQLPQIISLNQNQCEWNDLVSAFLAVINDFLHRMCNPPLNDELSSMLCAAAI